MSQRIEKTTCPQKQLFLPISKCFPCSEDTALFVLEQYRGFVSDYFQKLLGHTTLLDDFTALDLIRVYGTVLGVLDKRFQLDVQRWKTDKKYQSERVCLYLKHLLSKEHPEHSCPLGNNGTGFKVNQNCLSCAYLPDDLRQEVFFLLGNKWKSLHVVQEAADMRNKEITRKERQGEMLRKSMDPKMLHQTLFGTNTPHCDSLWLLQNYPADPLKINPINTFKIRLNSCFCDSVFVVMFGIPDPWITLQLDQFKARKQHYEEQNRILSKQIQDVSDSKLREVLAKNFLGRQLCLWPDVKTALTKEASLLDDVFTTVTDAISFMRKRLLLPTSPVERKFLGIREVMNQCKLGEAFGFETQDATTFTERLLRLLLFPNEVIRAVRIDEEVDEKSKRVITTLSDDKVRLPLIYPVYSYDNVLQKQTLSEILIQGHLVEERHRDPLQPNLLFRSTMFFNGAPYAIFTFPARAQGSKEVMKPDASMRFRDGTMLYLIGVVSYVGNHFVSFFLYHHVWYYYDDILQDPLLDNLDYYMMLDFVKTTGWMFFYSSYEH